MCYKIIKGTVDKQGYFFNIEVSGIYLGIKYFENRYERICFQGVRVLVILNFQLLGDMVLLNI